LRIRTQILKIRPQKLLPHGSMDSIHLAPPTCPTQRHRLMSVPAIGACVRMPDRPLACRTSHLAVRYVRHSTCMPDVGRIPFHLHVGCWPDVGLACARQMLVALAKAHVPFQFGCGLAISCPSRQLVTARARCIPDIRLASLTCGARQLASLETHGEPESGGRPARRERCVWDVAGRRRGGERREA
jgi:hypothetical protein